LTRNGALAPKQGQETGVKIKKLDHVNIRSERVPETLAFYTEVLGMTCRPPPGGKDMTRGAWIYDDGDQPVIHLGGFGGRYPGDGVLTQGQEPALGGGAIHHVALECQGYDEMVDRLKSFNLTIATSDIPTMNLKQVFVQDPNGVTLELNFR
jgi:catechol 2,3-dioxygenase-like lactoylglutathione lyase family enzyme